MQSWMRHKLGGAADYGGLARPRILLLALALAGAGCEQARPATAGPAGVQAQPAISAAAGPAQSQEPLGHTRPAATLALAQRRGVRVVTVRWATVPRFEVPQVKLADAAAARRINATLTRLLLTTNLTDTTQAAGAGPAIRRAVAEYEANNQVGLFGTSYEVLLNQGGLLSLALHYEYEGAYPWTATRYVTFDTQAGHRLHLPDLLDDTLALRQQWHRRITSRLRAYRREVTQGPTYAATDWKTVCEYTGWNDTIQQLRSRAQPHLGEFALTPKGLVLYMRFEFPHVVQALAPPDDYLFPYPEVAPWVKPGSLAEAEPVK